MNIFRETPEATLRQLMMSSRKPAKDHLPLINVQEPTKSLLVLKPTSKLPPKSENGQLEKPSYAEPVTHMGGLKMFVDDQSYKSFLAWIQDYASVVGDQYAAADDLPNDNWYPTKQVLRLSEVPESWPVTTGVQLFVHAWNLDKTSWETQPIAFTQGTVTPRRMVNGTLFLLAAKAGETSLDPQGAALSPGRYLVKAYVDLQHRLSIDPALILGNDEFCGQAEIQAQWHEGFPKAELISAMRLQK